MSTEKACVLTTDAGMLALWSPAAFAGVHDYDSWEAELLDDDDIARHISAAALVPVNIGSDGAYQVLVRAGGAGEAARLTEREETYRQASSEPYLFASQGQAYVSGIEYVEAAPREDWTQAVEAPEGRYAITVHLIDWGAEPGALTEEGEPGENALPDFVVLMNPAGADQDAFRTDLATFDQ